MKVGIIGCGNIADTYIKNSKKYFKNFQIITCADIINKASKNLANKYSINQISVEGLLKDKEVELVINLTTPQDHYAVSKSILESNKHAYSEKPISIAFSNGKRLLELAKKNNVYLGCAPDTFLGAGAQTAKKLLENNAIGKIQLGSIAMAVPGHETWHPNPDFYYKYGGGPILDMGPYYFTTLVNLLGPVISVNSKAKTVYKKRVIGSGERKNQIIKVEIPTSIISHLEFENGSLIDAFFSFDVWKHNKNHIELYGDKGSLNLPDPNMFGGSLKICKSKNGVWKTVLTDKMNLGRYNDEMDANTPLANYRGIGLAEMVDSIKNNRNNRCNAELGLHVLDIMDSILKSVKMSKEIKLRSTCKKPKYLSEKENMKLLKL